MKVVFVNRDFARVGFYKSILDEAGIPNFIRNQDVHTSEAAIPIFDPALVVEDHHYDSAMALLQHVHDAPEAEGTPWVCTKCHSDVPPNFETCWSCGAERSTPDAA